MLFRLIFWCKFIERQLNSVWLSLQATKEVPLKCYRYAYLLNQRMINYIKNFIYYLCYEVIEQNWLHFMDNLKKAQNLEEIMHFHNSFLNKCLTESLLVSSKLLPIVTVNLGNACHGYFQLRKYLNCIYEEKAIIHVLLSSLSPNCLGNNSAMLLSFVRCC